MRRAALLLVAAVAALSARRALGEPVLNEAILSELEDRLGVPKLLLFAALFRDQITKALEIMAATADRELLAREAHNLVSLAGNLGCSELMVHVRGLVSALPDEAIDIAPLVADVAGAARRALSAMDERYRT